MGVEQVAELDPFIQFFAIILTSEPQLSIYFINICNYMSITKAQFVHLAEIRHTLFR